jgi:hypothetical protein
MVNMKYEKVWEGSDLFGYEVIDFRIHFGKKRSIWRLYINSEVVKDEINKVSITGS